jgi:hypothetical protein
MRQSSLRLIKVFRTTKATKEGQIKAYALALAELLYDETDSGLIRPGTENNTLPSLMP